MPLAPVQKIRRKNGKIASSCEALDAVVYLKFRRLDGA